MITQKLLRSILIMTMIMIITGCGKDQPSIPYEDSLRSSGVTLNSMKDGQTESLLVGNGDFYGIVWEKEGNLFMRITKNDVWDARIDVSEDGDLPKVDVVNNLVTGMTGTPPSYQNTYPQPRCAAALKLGPVSAEDGFSAHLDLEKAYVSIAQAAGQNTVIRVLHGRNVLLVNSPHEVTIEEVQAETLPPAEVGTTGSVSWLLMKMPGDIDYKGMQYALAVATRGDLKAVSLVTSFDTGGNDVLEQAISLAEETVREQEKALVADHEKHWMEFWSRSGIALDDSVLQRWWYRMLYFANSVCRPGTSPVNLMPPLATDETPWHSDYHHNYNSWQAFWPLPAVNQAELADPWITYLNLMIPRFQFLAQETFGCEGIFAPISSFLHEPDPADCISKNKRQISFNPWGLTLGCAGMNVQNAWQIYLCDPDTLYLKTKIYPVIRESARFYVSFMEKCKTDDSGKIQLGPSYSPEHGSFGIFNCPFDIAYIHYTFDALIQAAAILAVDRDLAAKCLKFKALLPGYPVALNEEGFPVVVDWEGCRYGEVPVHNITVPASPVFPGDQVTWFSPEDKKELFKRTIRATRHNFNNSNVMFNIARARLSMPEAVNDAKEWFLSRELPNGLFVWQGHRHGTFMPEMIGIAGLINEFLLQSVDNKIRLFPCWPADQHARFSGLRTQGGFSVSAEFSNGKVTTATIESVAGGPLSLLSPWNTLFVNGEKVTVDNDGLFTINTKAGDVLHFLESSVEL
jgi:hypothetical protein